MKSLDILNRIAPAESVIEGISSDPELEAALEDVFSYHAPGAAGLIDIADIRAAAQEFAKAIILHAPQSADRSSALRHVRNAMMEANAAIVLGNGAEIVPSR